MGSGKACCGEASCGTAVAAVWGFAGCVVFRLVLARLGKAVAVCLVAVRWGIASFDSVCFGSSGRVRLVLLSRGMAS